MKLSRTNLTWNHRRIWIETDDAATVDRMEYRHGELQVPAHLQKEKSNEQRRVEEVTD
jgi:hypothetical protein